MDHKVTWQTSLFTCKTVSGVFRWSWYLSHALYQYIGKWRKKSHLSSYNNKEKQAQDSFVNMPTLFISVSWDASWCCDSSNWLAREFFSLVILSTWASNMATFSDMAVTCKMPKNTTVMKFKQLQIKTLLDFLLERNCSYVAKQYVTIGSLFCINPKQ